MPLLSDVVYLCSVACILSFDGIKGNHCVYNITHYDYSSCFIDTAQCTSFIYQEQGLLWEMSTFLRFVYFYFLYISVLPELVCEYLVLMEVRGHWILWNWSFRLLGATIHVLGTKPGSCVSASRFPNYCAISLKTS